MLTVGTVRDLKHMAQFCEGLEEGRLGLERLGELLDQKRIGQKHHAGSDSLLTACLHMKMMLRFEIDPQMCDGNLYGISKKLQSMAMVQQRKMIISFSMPPIYYPSLPISYITYY